MGADPPRRTAPMNFADIARAFFALAFTLGLMGVAAIALRRFGPDVAARFTTNRKLRRLAVVETLVLDPARRLVIVSCDGKERLLLLGEGQLMSPLDPPKGRG